MKRNFYAVYPESPSVVAFETREQLEKALEAEGLLQECSKEEAEKAASAWGDMMPFICGRCYQDCLEEVFPANCAEKPEKLLGAPIGQYHCPDCGAMVMAGIKHPELCKLCLDRIHPKFD